MSDEINLTASLHFQLGSAFADTPDFLAQEVLSYFESLRDPLHDGVYSRMRDGGGPETATKERGSIQVLTIGGDAPSIRAWSDLVQAWVDEFGLEARKAFPPWKEGSRLFGWVVSHNNMGVGIGGLLESQRRALGQLLGAAGGASEAERATKRTESVAFLIARAIWERGLPAPGDYVHAPFHSTFLEFAPAVEDRLFALGFEAAQRFNGVF